MGEVPTVGHLKKITVSLAAASASETVGEETAVGTHDFIYGLGPDGLTPFECRMEGTAEGGELLLCLKPGQIPQTFGHLHGIAGALGGYNRSLCLKIRVCRVVPAETREVVKAMADLASCGDDCCGHTLDHL